MVQRLREKHGLVREDAAESGAYARSPQQLELFERGADDAPSSRDLRVSSVVVTKLLDELLELYAPWTTPPLPGRCA